MRNDLSTSCTGWRLRRHLAVLSGVALICGCGGSTQQTAAPTLASETIAFASIAAQTAGTTLVLAATASSGLPVSFASTTPAVCTISGSTASFIASGICTVQATQGGNSDYAPAAAVAQSIVVNAAPQSIVFGAMASQAPGTSLALIATATSGLAVSYASTTSTVCTVSGSTASLVAAGICTIDASQAGNGIYSAATPVVQSFAVGTGLSMCATPASSNPAGGSGTYSQISIDPGVFGAGPTTGWTVFAFSQEANLLGPGDPQVLAVAPNVVPRAWAKWDTDGVLATDYNFGYPALAEAAGIVFIGGTTATVLFQDEFPAPADFNSVISCNAQGRPVIRGAAPSNYYRASMASPTYRQYIISAAERQIDGGVDGIFLDEVSGSYQGLTFNNNEGFDDADVADFGGFLCAKYPSLSTAQWQTKFGVTAADNLNCSGGAALGGRAFNYRGYLARNGWQTDPLTSANPLAAEWGVMGDAPQNGTFTNTYLYLVYWQDIVLKLRNYARQKYGREIYITSNGIYPFVDFQAPGLFDYNYYGPGGADQDFCPLTASGDLNGTESLMPAFLYMQQQSGNVAGRTVLFSVFIDWPTTVMTRYLSLPSSEQQDYWRMYMPEAYAVGVHFAMHLLDTVGDPSATQLGLMPFFEQTAAFYKMPAHAALYQSAQNLAGTVTVSTPNIATNLAQSGSGQTIAHLINHNYAKGFQTQSSVQVAFPVATAPAMVTLVSPDLTADTPVAFTYSGGQVQVTVPTLVAYTAVVAQ
jgi:hypothetical protein